MPHFKSLRDINIEQILTWLQQTFNNREIANGLWIILDLLFSLFRANFRSILWSVTKALIAPKPLLFFGTVALNVVALCWLLTEIGLWSKSQVPPTVLWFMMGGCVFTGRALQSQEDDQYFRSLFRDSLDLSLNCSAPLTWYFATKERHHGIEPDPRVPRRGSACRFNERSAA